MLNDNPSAPTGQPPFQGGLKNRGPKARRFFLPPLKGEVVRRTGGVVSHAQRHPPFGEAFRLPFATAHGPSVPHFGEPSGSRSLTLTGRQSPTSGSLPAAVH
ncbi:hypothetical protein FF3_02248 [Fretibacterium fastidiosum]